MIKLYTDSDLEKLVKFTKELKDNLSIDEYSKKYIESEAYRNHWLREPRFITHYSEENNSVNGFIIMSPRGFITLELDMLYVKPGSRRKGIATSLKQVCVDWGKDHKYQFICSQVGSTNDPSIALNHKSRWSIHSQNYDTILFYQKLT